MADYLDASKLGELARTATASYISSSKRATTDKLYSTLEDFTRADTSKKRLVVIGCTGSGKSTLLNVMAGWRFVQSPETDYQFLWKKKQVKKDGDAVAVELDPIFESAASSDSVTKKAAFANIHYRGQEDRELIVVDTPGHDDPAGNEIDSQEARDALGAIAADLHNKLKALGHVHAILVLHNDVVSNRLNPATYQILKMVDEKFSKAGGSVWNHVVIGYSKCNAFETTWRAALETKKTNLRQTIKEKISTCNAALPILCLGGGEIEPPPPNADEADGLEKLWDFIQAADPLDTSELQPFEGADVKWQKMIDAKDQAEAQAKAAIIYVAVLLKLGMVLATLFWRHAMLPSWMSFFLFNLPGVVDELLILAFFVYWVGPYDVLYSLQHFYRSWVEPKARPYVDQAMAMLMGPNHGTAGMAKAKEE